MNPVQPEELSALLDGELDTRRTAEVERQIAADPQLQAEFELLAGLDEDWRAAARTAAFAPEVRIPAAGRWNGWALTLAVAIGLVGVRAGVRLIEPVVIAFAFQALVLAAVLAGVVWLGWTQEQDGRSPSPRPAT